MSSDMANSLDRFPNAFDPQSAQIDLRPMVFADFQTRLLSLCADDLSADELGLVPSANRENVTLDRTGGSFRNREEFVIPTRWAKWLGFQVKVRSYQVFLFWFQILRGIGFDGPQLFCGFDLLQILNADLFLSSLTCFDPTRESNCQQQTQNSDHDKYFEKCKTSTPFLRPAHD
jgi:hypothetical protein